MPTSIFTCSGFKNVSAESHRDAAEIFALASAHRKFGRRGRVGALNALTYSADGTAHEWSVFIGRPTPDGRGIDGHNIQLVTQTK